MGLSEADKKNLLDAKDGLLDRDLVVFVQGLVARAWDKGYEAGKDSEVYNDSPVNPYAQ